MLCLHRRMSSRVTNTTLCILLLVFDGFCKTNSFLLVYGLSLQPPSASTATNNDCSSSTRRSVLTNVATTTAAAIVSPFCFGSNSILAPPSAYAAPAVDSTASNGKEAEVVLFETAAYGRQEYTNSITASRDTNISPAEAYDVIRQWVPSNSAYDTTTRTKTYPQKRALDVGAGAGLSTAILYNEKGYHNIDAVDWSRLAWDDSVRINTSNSGVTFYEMDDTSFFQQQSKSSSNNYYDVIVYNFAINSDKAIYAATNFLNAKNSQSVLLAPCNDKRDYWEKQSYIVLNATGDVLWKSKSDVDAWSIQFQPDVTSRNCVGIWCGTVNGFLSS